MNGKRTSTGRCWSRDWFQGSTSSEDWSSPSLSEKGEEVEQAYPQGWRPEGHEVGLDHMLLLTEGMVDQVGRPEEAYVPPSASSDLESEYSE